MLPAWTKRSLRRAAAWEHPQRRRFGGAPEVLEIAVTDIPQFRQDDEVHVAIEPVDQFVDSAASIVDRLLIDNCQLYQCDLHVIHRLGRGPCPRKGRNDRGNAAAAPAPTNWRGPPAA